MRVCVSCAQQALSGRMSACISTLENNQVDFRHQLSKVLMTNQSNEQALKANSVTLNNLAIMVTTTMNKLESRTVVSPPEHARDNEVQIHGKASKSLSNHQAQFQTNRTGPSNPVAIEVGHVSFVPSEDKPPPQKKVK